MRSIASRLLLPTTSFLLAIVPVGCQEESRPQPQDRPIETPAEIKRDPAVSYRYPSYVTQFDVSTRDDLRYAHLLRPVTAGEVSEWKLLNDFAKALGTLVGKGYDAKVIADTITTSLPVRGNPPLKPIDELVNDCAKILHVSKPDVFIRNDPNAQIYAAGVSEPHMLVITSGMLNLYDGAPDEFRFVIGRELGHIKAKHVQLRLVSRAILTLLLAVDERFLKSSGVLPTLALGHFLSWSRESEISADRAGLLCCQDEQVAFNAMARMLHGLSPGSTWPDPSQPNFNPESIVASIRQWESKPFVEFIVAIKHQSAEHPFVPERIAALKLWNQSGVPATIIARTETPSGNQLVQLDVVLVKNLADGNATVDPYLKVIGNSGATMFNSTVQYSLQTAAWKELDRQIVCQDGQPIFVEIWDHNDVFSDQLLGMFTLYPQRGVRVYETGILWDVNERKAVTRDGVAKAKITFFEERE